MPAGMAAMGLYLPSPGISIEVAYAVSDHRPRKDELRRAWKDRHGGRATGVLLVVGHDGGEERLASLVGLHEDAVAGDLDVSVVERYIRRALEAGSTRQAENLLSELFEHPDDLLPAGLRNEGLFTSHSLVTTAPDRPWWSSARDAARGLRGHAGEDLLRALGWTVATRGGDLLLRDGEHARAIAVLLEGDDVFDRPALRYGFGTSPVEHGIQVARDQELRWVLAVQGARIRLYGADPDTGVARGGPANFAEVNVDLIDDEHLAYVWSLLSPGALRRDGMVDEILADSREHAASLGERLRERLYVNVIPRFAETIARKSGDLSEAGLAHAYHVTLVVLFRLLFVAYAEDRGLLPYRTNTVYTPHALRTRARELAERSARQDFAGFDTRATDLWNGLREIWRAILRGNADWGVPEYGGSLFRDDSRIGREIDSLVLTNAEIGPALDALLVDVGPDDVRGPVDFRALSVREFGTIYEGLLESSLSVAPTDLGLDSKKAYVPVKIPADVVVRAGEVYFHNASGVRKATGSYFTKEFAVEHLLETALDPTVAEHLERVAALMEDGREADAAASLFDLSVADIAMGSGHFLVAAVDHIAKAFEAFLARRSIPGVQAELDALRTAALAGLRDVGVVVEGPEAPQVTVSALLRRQIAKRCIYGVDINEIAVDLARLALWIHTFVPGLPMSDLTHGLVHGNSLTGIGTLGELIDVLEPEAAGQPGAHSLFRDEVVDALAAAAEPIRRAARLAEVTADETREAESLRDEAETLLTPVRAAMDVAIAGRLDVVDLRLLTATGWAAVVAAALRADVREEIKRLEPVHFPVSFPEVFWGARERPGFDVVLGNPPWEKVKVEEHGWWGLRFPGLRSMSQRDKNSAIATYRRERSDLVAEYEADVERVEAERDVLKAGPYPLGSGDTDLYKVFCWRDWALLRAGGRAGVVFPRGALSGSGAARWREGVLENGAFDDVCFLTNTKQWVFEEVHPQYTVALTTVRRGGANEVRFCGPFHSRREFDSGRRAALVVDADEFVTWAAGAAFPLLPSNQSAGVFRRMRRHPRFDSTDGFEFRPVAELHTSANKNLYDFNLADRGGDLEVLTGGSFNLWEPDFGEPYAYADKRAVELFLLNRRRRQVNDRRSAFFGLGTSWARDLATLPMRHARIAFRDVARATDSRTFIAALLPPGVVLVEKCPYLFRARGAAIDEAFVLGVLCSMPLDWYARRYVELKLSYGLLNAFPLPRPASDNAYRSRTVEIAGCLAAVDDRYAAWAADVGVPVGSVRDQAAKDDLIAELDAVVSHLYGLTREDVEHIFSTFHRGWDYQPRLTAVLAHYDRWAGAR